MTNHSGGKDPIEAIVNKSFLILDQIQESYFPLLEKCIFTDNSSDPTYKSKISKLEFVIQQRIKYVEGNCNNLENILIKLPKSEENSNVELITYRLNQLRSEQKRILTAFKQIKHKRVEKERAEREQEELLTRRFTTSTVDSEQSKFCDNYVIDLDDDSTDDKTHKKKGSSANNKSTTAAALSNKLRNQKPLVKRVRTRYLDFSTDFFGMTKVFLKYSCVDWILLFGFSLVIITLIFCLIVWQTSPRHYEQ